MKLKLLTLCFVLLLIGFGSLTAFAQIADTSDYPPAPDSIMKAEFSTIDGKKFTLADLKGKIVLVNLWGIWCGPCRDQMPFLSKLQTKYGESGFEVIGVNIGDSSAEIEPAEKLKKYSEAMNVGYTVTQTDLAITKSVYSLSRQEAVPQSILIDRDGRLRGVFVGGGTTLNKKLERLVEKTIDELPLQRKK